MALFPRRETHSIKYRFSPVFDVGRSQFNCIEKSKCLTLRSRPLLSVGGRCAIKRRAAPLTCNVMHYGRQAWKRVQTKAARRISTSLRLGAVFLVARNESQLSVHIAA